MIGAVLVGWWRGRGWRRDKGLLVWANPNVEMALGLVGHEVKKHGGLIGRDPHFKEIFSTIGSVGGARHFNIIDIAVGI